MRVRPLRTEDLDPLGRALKEIVDEGRWLSIEPPVTAAEMSERIARSRAGGDRAFVLESADGSGTAAPVGVSVLRETSTAGVFSIGMWIERRHRGKGGGRMLLDAAVASRPRTAHKVELEVWEDNEAAITLYERAGFERGAVRERRWDGTLRPIVSMARIFTPA